MAYGKGPSEFAKRLFAKDMDSRGKAEGAGAGEDPDAQEPGEGDGESDDSAPLADAARSLARALGLDPGKVDAKRVKSALASIASCKGSDEYEDEE